MSEPCPQKVRQKLKQVFVVAGGGKDSNLECCEMFDAADFKWSEIALMQTQRHALAVTSTQTAVYAVGGWCYGSKCTGALEVYDVTKQEWELKAEMITPRRLHGAAAAGGRIFVFGGASETEYEIKQAESYDPELDRWEACPPLPVGSYASAAAVDDRSVFVFLWGKQVLKYDIEARTYEPMSKLPMPEWYGFATTPLGTSIYVVGGATKGRWSKKAYRFDTINGSWHELPSMRGVRRRCAAAAIEY
mmetsp:Transcript_26697/g.41787  ORF Transcript_26697/g.41787 Transcript_26697/m.41787 type:complete len:247 (-) Transcript_26697:285-1025(-)